MKKEDIIRCKKQRKIILDSIFKGQTFPIIIIIYARFIREKSK